VPGRNLLWRAERVRSPDRRGGFADGDVRLAIDGEPVTLVAAEAIVDIRLSAVPGEP